jgi:hypothetical protein
MSYIEKTLDRINEILLENGCGLYQPDLHDIGDILAEVIISANLQASLVDEASAWLNTPHEGYNHGTIIKN